MTDAYDEQSELTKYVWNNYQALVDDWELFANKAFMAREKSLTVKSAIAIRLEKQAKSDDPRVIAALQLSHDDFRNQVRRRLLSERSDEIAINRCPECDCIVRTPQARQCFWCGHDWHGVSP